MLAPSHHHLPAAGGGVPSPTMAVDDTEFGFPPRPRRKRKAESQVNERLNKRMSLLNIEKGGTILYVPVEGRQRHTQGGQFHQRLSRFDGETPRTPLPHPPVSSSQRPAAAARPPPDTMQLDDNKYKVYIYNIDDELSSDGENSDDGKLVFLPNIEKHIRANRIPIPPPILPNKEGELAGMQLVLYQEPTSLTVPEKDDSVRRAVVESRRRLRERQVMEREGGGGGHCREEFGMGGGPPTARARPVVPMGGYGETETMPRQNWMTEQGGDIAAEDDPDAMDLS